MFDDRYDVAIIGTGAGGGTLAHRLAATGRRILLLERGGWLPRERDNWSSTAVFVEGRYRAPEFWYDRHGREFPPEVNYYVGGNTKFYGAALFRLRPEDFGELRHHGGMSPAWPITYDDLEPCYTQAEHLYRVHGRHGEDPTAGTASEAKSDAQVVCVEPALAHPGVELVTHAHVQRLETDPSGRTVTAVVTQVGDEADPARRSTVRPTPSRSAPTPPGGRAGSRQGKGMPIGATAHQAGTVRFGTDPRTSALDVNCRAHDLDNLYVVDTSFFPSIGAVNPSLTAIANTLRVGDHLAARLG